MGLPPNAKKSASVVWSVLIGVLIIVFAGAVLLPSTKRAHISIDELRREKAENDAARVADDAARAAGVAKRAVASTVPSDAR
jgi:hypothetical protein